MNLIRRLVLLVFISTISGAAITADPEIKVVPQADGSVVFTLSPEKVKACQEQGGCRLLSVAEMEEFIVRIKPKLCSEISI